MLIQNSLPTQAYRYRMLLSERRKKGLFFFLSAKVNIELVTSFLLAPKCTLIPDLLKKKVGFSTYRQYDNAVLAVLDLSFFE